MEAIPDMSKSRRDWLQTREVRVELGKRSRWEGVLDRENDMDKRFKVMGTLTLSKQRLHVWGYHVR